MVFKGRCRGNRCPWVKVFLSDRSTLFISVSIRCETMKDVLEKCLADLEARIDEDSCSRCHTRSSCQQCHAGDNVRPRSHPLNFAFNHALEARGNSLECAGCHYEPEFCSGCHVAERILPANHSEAGWLDMNGGGRHATEGMFDMESCIACHGAGAGEPSCARCHGG